MEWHLQRALSILRVESIPAAYAVDAAEFGQGDASAYGYTFPTLAMHLKPLLESKGQWQGPGFAFVYNGARILADVHEGCLFEVSRDLFLHELAHYLVAPLTEAWQSFWEKHADPMLSLIADSIQPVTKGPASSPWRPDHGLSFVRACVHLAVRANVVRLEGLNVAGARYGLSPVGRYAHAFGDEARERYREPIRAIIESPPPFQALQLFERDAAAYRRRRGQVSVSPSTPEYSQ